MRRGEIWWASLGKPRGSGPGFRRPILILQSDAFNRSLIRTVIGVVITSNLRLAEAPGNVLLKAKSSGLPRGSVVNVSQIVTIDKSFLAERVRALPHKKLEEVEAGLRLVVGL